MMSTTPESSQPKKRESRAGTRKVTSLSAEQLERKRANDREAQRTIRQRTKEHIERLEHQVAELKSKGEQYDDVVRRNGALENEIRVLRQQLAMAQGRQYGNMAPEIPYNNTPSGPLIPGPHFPEPLGMTPSSRAPSTLSTSSQVSVTPDWPPYGSTRSSSICESTDTDYANRVEPYVVEGQLRPPNPMPVAPPPHIGFSAGGGGPPADPSYQHYSQLYTPAGPNQGHAEGIPHPQQQPMSFMQVPRSMSVPNVPPEREARAYPILQSQPHYQNPAGQQQQPRNEYTYDWSHRP
ncbi:hypothetical protein FE257_001355 [Aspergillus nanangensis]|uniref:BZIP transcription factor n=1 Tax=Aspergillus nanangensis TaxID=2582783 RepID=A0AAD4CE73_ASPNN|nr:hypothetical protein FE257_001355 [Aspergillus nanangensis]